MAERDRHLAAIWFADIVGYTQLTGKNEDAAFGLVDALQQRARAVIVDHGGRLVNCIGDAVLAEFGSTEAAIRAALALRDGFASDSRALGQPAQIRIGLHVGDLRTASDGHVYGDGVNMASRLQGLAQPGQIVVSQDVWRQLRPRAEYELRSLGEHRLKGIAGTAVAFSADRRPGGAHAPAASGAAGVGVTDRDSIWRRFPETTRARALWGGAMLALVLGTAALLPWLKQAPSALLRPRAAHAAPSPSVVILPFTVEGGADDDLWGEGVANLMALSIDASRHLRVISARTVNRHLADPATRLAAADLYELADDLGARYAIMGRLVHADERITLQADMYDVQQRQRLGVVTVDGSVDRIASHVDLLATRALALGTDTEASLAERPPLTRLATSSIPALLAYFRGEQLYRRSRLSAARDHFATAVEADPAFALARYRLALTEAWNELPHQPRVNVHQIEAERHVSRLSERDSLLVTGFGQLNRRDPAALRTLSHLVVRFPDETEGWFLLGDARFHMEPAGTRTDAAEALREALRLDPGYGPAYVHLIDAAVEANDTTQVRAWLTAYRRVDPGSPLLSGFEWALQLARTQAPAGGSESDDAEDIGRAGAEPDAAPPPPVRRQVPVARSEPERAAAESHARTAESHARIAQLALLDSLALAVQQAAAAPGLEPAAVREAGGWQEAARLARAADQLPQAEAHYRRANEVLARARAAPEPQPEPVEPSARPALETGPVHDDIAGVLAGLESAIEAKDVGRMREVWTSLSTAEADYFRRSLPGMRNLAVSFEILEVSPAPQAAVIRVQTTYVYQNSRGQQERQAFGQVFRIARSGGSWVIVQSSTP